MAMLGSVALHIEKEKENYAVNVTEYAVEKGEPYSDHVEKRSPTFSVNGTIIAKNFDAAKNKLIHYMELGFPLKYVGKMSASNVIILSIEGGHSSSISNGMEITINLRRIRIATTSWLKAQKPTTESGKKKPVNKKPSTKKYHVMKKGQTYWYVSKKYGTSISQLRKWNKWPDRKIPIGAKVRYK